MSKTTKELLTNNLVTWNGIHSLMERGWRQLPIRIDEKSIKVLDVDVIEVLVSQVESVLRKYHIRVSNIKAFSILNGGYLCVQIDESKNNLDNYKTNKNDIVKMFVVNNVVDFIEI